MQVAEAFTELEEKIAAELETAEPVRKPGLARMLRKVRKQGKAAKRLMYANGR